MSYYHCLAETNSISITLLIQLKQVLGKKVLALLNIGAFLNNFYGTKKWTKRGYKIARTAKWGENPWKSLRMKVLPTLSIWTAEIGELTQL